MAEFLELLDALRATRDTDSCLRGLNLFRKGLRGEEGPAFLARYLRQSPDWQELQHVWDTQLTVQHYHVTVTLLLALADALRTAAAGAADSTLDAAARAALAAGAARLAGSVLHRRLKALYFCLSSDMRGKCNAALALLAAVAGALAASGGAGAPAGAAAAPAASLRDLVRAFDWSLSALPGLARPPREKKGESAADLRLRYWQQWALGDPLKRPTRALLSAFALCLLRHAGGDALLTQQLLQLRPLVGGLLHHIGADPPSQQLEVLHALQRRVLSAKAAVPAAVQAEVFSDAALQQLANIASSAAVEGQEDDSDEQGAAADGEEQQAKQAAAAALAILEALATQPAHGLAADGRLQRQFALTDAGSHQLLPGQRRLLRLLLRLRPADSAAHLQLLLAAAASDAALVAALLPALPYSLEPAAVGLAAAGSAAAGRWFAHAAVAARLLQLLPDAAPSGLLLHRQGGGAAPPAGGRRAQALLRCCLPPCLQRAALSRGLQHANPLVRYGTLGLLISGLSALEAVLLDCAAAEGAAGAAQHRQAAEARQSWLVLRRWLQQAARQQLPDPTLLLAMLSAAEKEGWEAANELQLTAVLRLLLLWQRVLPAALAEANVDAERLLPAQPLALRPQHQLLLLELLQAVADAAGDSAAGAADEDGGGAATACAAPAVPSATALLPPLRMLVGGRHAAVRSAARRWLLKRLLATAAFEGNSEEAVLWLDLLPRGGETACAFLVEAVQMLLRRPHELFEQQQELLSAAGASGGASGSPQFSLLALCALRQLLRVLGSTKMPGADKAAVAAYVAAVLRQLLEQQLGGNNGSNSGAALASVLLGVARQEAARRQQQADNAGVAASAAGGDSSGKEERRQKKRKAAAAGANGGAAGSGGTPGAQYALPAEGEPLFGLLGALERQLSPAAAPAREDGRAEPPSKKPKKNRQAEASEPGPAAADAEACCVLISRLAGSSPGAFAAGDTAQLLAAIQQQLAAEAEASTGGASAGGTYVSGASAVGVGTRSAAVRQCLHLLGQPGLAGAAPALLQVLRYASLAAGSAAEQRRCLQLLAGSAVVAEALGSIGGSGGSGATAQALAGTVVQVLLQVLQSADKDAASAACCAPLLEQIAARFHEVVGGEERDADDSGSLPEAVASFLLLLPHMPAAAATAAADILLERLAAESHGATDSGGGCSGSKSGKKRKRKEAAKDAEQRPSWLCAATAAVLQQLSSGDGLRQRHVEQGCAVLPRLAAAGESAAFDCLLCLLRGQHGLAALAELGPDAVQNLLRCCLQPACAGSLGTRSHLAALLARQAGPLAAEELLPLLLDGGSALAALAAPAAAALLEQQQEEAAAVGACKVDPCAPLAAALGRALEAYFMNSNEKGDAGASKATEAANGKKAGGAEGVRLLRRHALPCLRQVLARRALDGQQRQRLLAALLPAQGWPAVPAAGSGPSTAELAEAAVLLTTSSGGGGSADLQQLTACVQCFAATLASLMRLPPDERHLEASLLALLDGPVGDAVAALPSAQRSTAVFADLAAAAAGTLGTAVLRHRLAATPSNDAAAAAAAAAGVAAMRALRRFMAALLPEEAEEEAAAGAGGGHSAGKTHGGSESEADSSSSSSSSSDSDDDAPVGDRGVHNPSVAEAALQLLHRLLGHSRFLPAMRAAAASPPPLPPAAEAAARPLASLLPLAAAADSPDVPAGAALDAHMKKELCELIETLLDLHQQYSGSGGADGGGASVAAAQQAQQVTAAEAALLPLLMAGYGASCSPTDAAVWSLAAAINQRQWQREQRARRSDAGATATAELAAEGDPDVAALAALLHGPLARTSFAWGPAATALQQRLPADAASGVDAVEAQRAQQRQLLQQRLSLDPLRAALTVCHWPEACSLAAPGSSGQQDSQQDGGGSGNAAGQPAPLPGCAAAYDPGFLLPFCCCCLQQQLLAPRAFAEAGLLSVCLRGLAASDPACRAAAYQALALYEAQLNAEAALDFREKQQLSVLLSTLRATITRPFHRLPAVHAVFLAEAALLALHPGSAMYPAVNKQITRRATLAVSDVPLLGQLLMSGGQQHVVERRWMLQLLLAGLRGGDDASLYRRKHAFEQAMALHDLTVADPAVASLALRLLCTATYVPRAARQLARESGLIPWLAGVAQAAFEQLAQQGFDTNSSSAGGKQGTAESAEQALEAPLAALRRLLQLRAVMRGVGGAGVAQQMLAAARQLAGTAVAAACGAGGASDTAAPLVCHNVLPFLQEVQQQLGGGGSGPTDSRRLPGGAQGLKDIAAAVQALTTVAEAAA